MIIIKNIKEFVLIFVLFIVIDVFWLKFYMKDVYEKLIKDIQGTEMKIRIYSALFVYVCMTILLLKFRNNNILDMFLLGLLTYGIYDFTNYALFTKFDFKTALVDMLWGGLLFALVAKLTNFIVTYH
jgi:uncharacterized membrane protein